MEHIPTPQPVNPIPGYYQHYCKFCREVPGIKPQSETDWLKSTDKPVPTPYPNDLE